MLPSSTGNSSSSSSLPHQLQGHLLFLSEAIVCLRRAEPLPPSLAFVPCEVQYKLCKDPSAPPGLASALGRRLLSVWESPDFMKGPIELWKSSCIQASSEEYYNGQGLWVKLTRVRP